MYGGFYDKSDSDCLAPEGQGGGVSLYPAAPPAAQGSRIRSGGCPLPPNGRHPYRLKPCIVLVVRFYGILGGG